MNDKEKVVAHALFAARVHAWSRVNCTFGTDREALMRARLQGVNEAAESIREWFAREDAGFDGDHEWSAIVYYLDT